MAGISNLSAIHRYPFAPWLPHSTTSFTHFHLHLHFHELHLLPYGKIGGDEMRLRALLETDALGLRLLGGEDELDRTVRGVMTTDLRDPSRYLSGGELVLTGLAWHRDAADSEPFVRILAGAGVAGLAAGEAELRDIPADLVEASPAPPPPPLRRERDRGFRNDHRARRTPGLRRAGGRSGGRGGPAPCG